jgi:hypothetical protein
VTNGNGDGSIEINPGVVAGRLVERAEYLAASGDVVSAGLMLVARRTIVIAMERITALTVNAAPSSTDGAPQSEQS